jgi:hypothetical protein
MSRRAQLAATSVLLLLAAGAAVHGQGTLSLDMPFFGMFLSPDVGNYQYHPATSVLQPWTFTSQGGIGGDGGPWYERCAAAVAALSPRMP